jgi:predicted transcriptional regulator
MMKKNKPLRPSEICKITNINSNTVNGIIRNGYAKRFVIDKIDDGLYQINKKGINLLDITEDV